MPTQQDVENVRSALLAANDKVLLGILRSAGYKKKPSDKPITGPSRKAVHINSPTSIEKYLEATGFSINDIRGEIVSDICGTAYSAKDEFWAVFRAAGLTSQEEHTISTIESIGAKAGSIAESSELTAERLRKKAWWRDGRYFVPLAVAIIGGIIFGGLRLWLAWTRK